MSKRIEKVISQINSYNAHAVFSGGGDLGHAIASHLGIINETNVKQAATIACTHIGSNGKLAATAISMADAVIKAFNVHDSALVEAMLSADHIDRSDWPEHKLTAKARATLGFFLVSMCYRSKVVDIVASDGTPVREVETYATKKIRPAAVEVLRIAKASGNETIAKKFKITGDVTKEAAQRMAEEWISEDPERAGYFIKYIEGGELPNFKEGEKSISGSNQTYRVVETGGSIKERLSYTSTTPFEPWTAPEDSEGRELVNGRYFKPDAKQFDSIWVNASNRLESVGYRVNMDMLNLINRFDGRKKHFLGKTVNKRRAAKVALEAAEELGDQTFYQRASMDFRGRLFLSKSKLNYQGGDLSRSLIDLAQGQPLTDEGFEALLLHAANCNGGQDGMDRATRIVFARKSLDLWRKWGSDPVTHFNDWTRSEIEKPFSFIRVCMELAKVRVGDVSHILCEIDGTNNGLQWHAIMMQDEKLAHKTNLKGGNDRQDFYKEVGEALDIDQASAKERRKISKIASMEFQYGAAPKRIAKDLREAALESPQAFKYLSTLDLNLYLKGRDYVASDDLIDIAQRAVDALNNASDASARFKEKIHDFYNSRILMTTCTDAFRKRYEKAEDKSQVTLPKALDALTASMTDEEREEAVNAFINGEQLGDDAITYVTPSDFPVHIKYFKSSVDASRLYLDDGISMPVKSRIYSEELNTNKMKTASLANITHSLDATHCHLVLHLTDFDVVTIHDAFACHPNNSIELVKTIMQTMAALERQQPLRLLELQGRSLGRVEFTDEDVEGMDPSEKRVLMKFKSHIEDRASLTWINFNKDFEDMGWQPAPNICVNPDALEAFS